MNCKTENKSFSAVELKSENKLIGHIYFNRVEPKKLFTYEMDY